MNVKLFALSKKLVALFAILILLPSAAALAQAGSISRPAPAAPVEQMPAGEAGPAPSGLRAPATRAAANPFQAGGERLALLQNNDGGWDWPLDDGNPASASPKNTVGPIAQGLALAYLHTGDLSQQGALRLAGDFLLAKTN